MLSIYKLIYSKSDNKSFNHLIGNIRTLVLASFFFSGMASLIYQVLWVRQLSLVFGTTLQSVSTVLSVFMAGLALGSFLFGRLIDRTNKPLKIFAILEIGIGVYGMLIPLIFKWLTSVQIVVMRNLPDNQIGITLIRILLCFLVLIIPTILMGGTLPVIVKYFVRKQNELGGGLGKLYFMNTLGAVFGSFIAGFFLIQYIGVLATTFLASSIDLSIGVIFLLLRNRLAVKENLIPPDKQQVVSIPLDKTTKKQVKRHDNKKEKKYGAGQQFIGYSRTMRITVLLGFGFSGLASLGLEVSWTRTLTLVLGSSVYAFSLMLTAFLLGIALGSSMIARFIDRKQDVWFYFFIVEVFIGLSIIVLNALLGQLPLLFVSVFSSFQTNFWVLQTVQFLLSFLIMLVPTFLMGAAFPIAAKIYTQDIEHIGGSVGRLYSGNTFGSMVGPLLVGFIIIPIIGIQWSISIIASIYLVIALSVFLASIGLQWHKVSTSLKGTLNLRRIIKIIYLIPMDILRTIVDPRRMVKILTLLALIGILVVSCLLPTWATWDRGIMTSGVFIYANRLYGDSVGDLSERLRGDTQILFYDESLLSTVTVGDQSDGNRFLRIDGKVDASSYGDLGTELLSGHLPMLLHPDPKKVLLVGLGSGITLGAIEQYSSVENITAIEIDAAVIKAASYFSESNKDALKYANLKMVEADARNYLLASTEKYDVITAEPSNPWMSGNSILFAKEQFELYKKGLSDNGIICQWIHYYSMGTEDLKTVFNTFRSVFNHCTLWGKDADLLLIGSKSEFSIDLVALEKRLQEEDVLTDLNRIYIKDPYGVLGMFIMGDDSLARYCSGAPLHTDNRPILQFSAPKNLHNEHSFQQNIESIEPFIENVLPYLTNVQVNDAREKLQSYIDYNLHYRKAMIYNEQGNLSYVIDEYQSILVTRVYEGFIHGELGLLYRNQGKIDEAVYHLKLAVAENPSAATYFVRLGDILGDMRKYQDALDTYKNALKLVKTNAFIYYKCAYAYQQLPDPDIDQAINIYNKAIATYPFYANAFAQRGYCYLVKRNFTQAVIDFNRAIQFNPNLAIAYGYRGIAYSNLNDYDNAIADSINATILNPTTSTYVNLGVIYTQAGYYFQVIGYFKQSNEYYSQASTAFAEAIEVDNNCVAAYLNRGQLYANTGDPLRAIDDFDKVIDLEPANINTYFYRGLAYFSVSNKDLAIKDFDRVIDLAPGTELAEQARVAKAELAK